MVVKVRLDMVPVPGLLGEMGIMEERISAKQSATSLFGAQAKAGVYPGKHIQFNSMFRHAN